MSKESLDYSILCPNYYTNWEDGCCMENCTHNDLDLCPIHYVKGLLEDKDQQIADLEAKLAESEEQVWALENQKLHAHNCLNKLKQQLTEKEKELDKYAELFGMKDKDFYVVEKTEYDKMKQGTKDIMREFTIKKLKQVKDNYQAFDGIELVGYIDQLIAEIKGGKVV